MRRLTTKDIHQIQKRLNTLGFGPLAVDGIRGRGTNNAITRFKASIGLRPRPVIGPLTWEALFKVGNKTRIKAPIRVTAPDIPW